VFRGLRPRDEAAPVKLSDYKTALQQDTRALTLFHFVPLATLQQRGSSDVYANLAVPVTGTYIIANYDPELQLYYMLCKESTGSQGQYKLCFMPADCIGVGKHTSVQLQTVGENELRRVREIEQWAPQLAQHIDTLTGRGSIKKLDDAGKRARQLLDRIVSTLIRTDGENTIEDGDSVPGVGRSASSTRIFNMAEEDPGKFGNGFPDEQQQRRVREVRFIDTLFDGLSRLVNSRSSSPSSAPAVDSAGRGSAEQCWDIVPELIKTLIRTFIGNPTNQHYVTKRTRMLTLLCDVCNTEVWAIHALAYLHHNNKMLLEDLDLRAEGLVGKLTSMLGAQDSTKLWRCEISVPITRFLRELVTCDGFELYSNQNAVLQRVYEHPALRVETKLYELAQRGSHVREKMLIVSWPSTLFQGPNDFGKKFFPFRKRFGDIQDSKSQISYVGLAYVAWTLEPDTCFNLQNWQSHGSTRGEDESGSGRISWAQKIKGSRAEAQFWQLRQIARYYTEQILLAAECCAGRNETNARYLDAVFTFDGVLHGLRDPVLPLELRSAFAKLMRHKYLDRAPHEAVSVPVLVRFRSEFEQKWVMCTKMKIEAMTESEKKQVEDELPAAEKRRKRSLEFLDTGFMTLFLCSLVVFAVVVAFLEGGGTITNEKRFDPVRYLMFFITIVFILEVSIRIWAMRWAKFKNERICMIDLLVTIVDVLCTIMQFALEDGAENGALNSAKSLRFIRVVRGLRFMRVLRLARYFSKAHDYLLQGGDMLSHCYALHYHQDPANPLPSGVGGCSSSGLQREHFDQMKQYFETSTEYFTKLQGRQHINDITTTSYVSTLLANLQTLMRFGYFTQVEEIRVLCWQLIILLDGRSDMVLETTHDQNKYLRQLTPHKSWKQAPKKRNEMGHLPIQSVLKLKRGAEKARQFTRKKSENQKQSSPKKNSMAEKWLKVRKFVKKGSLGKQQQAKEQAQEREEKAAKEAMEGVAVEEEEKGGEAEGGGRMVAGAPTISHHHDQGRSIRLSQSFRSGNQRSLSPTRNGGKRLSLRSNSTSNVLDADGTRERRISLSEGSPMEVKWKGAIRKVIAQNRAIKVMENIKKSRELEDDFEDQEVPDIEEWGELEQSRSHLSHGKWKKLQNTTLSSKNTLGAFGRTRGTEESVNRWAKLRGKMGVLTLQAKKSQVSEYESEAMEGSDSKTEEGSDTAQTNAAGENQKNTEVGFDLQQDGQIVKTKKTSRLGLQRDSSRRAMSEGEQVGQLWLFKAQQRFKKQHGMRLEFKVRRLVEYKMGL
jgi:hypothetical protein